MERQLHHRYDSPAGWHRTVLCLTWGILILSGGCDLIPRSRPPIPPVGVLQYDVDYLRGLPLPGSKPADGNSLHLENSPGITVTFVPLDAWPENALAPVESQTQTITVLPANSAVAPVAGLLRRARIGVVQSETQILGHAPVHEPPALLSRQVLQGILPEGVAASFRILERPDADTGALRKLEIQVRRGPGRAQETKEPAAAGISLAVSLIATGQWREAALPEADSTANAAKEQQSSVSAASALLTTETIQLTPRDLQEQDRLAVVLPSPLAVEGIVAFAALIEVKPPPRSGTDEAATYAALQKECQDRLRTAAAAGGEPAELQPGAGRRGIEDAIPLLSSPTHGRRALLYLAHETGSPLIEDIALSATDVVIDRLAQAITQEWDSGPAVDANASGWRLQKTAYQLLVELMSADQSWPELEAIAIRYTGEVGRHPAVLKEMVSEAAGAADLEQRLLLENFIYLEDISPAARTRAFEWLTAKGRAPAGFDPLAPLKERRTVLNRALQEQQ